MKANEVFLSGSFTASDGTTIPYRYYFPEDYETSGKTYPLFLHMHGNGSRGTDNERQLTTVGGVFVNRVFDSGVPCIFLAPQCPSSPKQWVTAYPGSVEFAEGLKTGVFPADEYLSAAEELLLQFIRENRIDTSRIYVSGGSNGGGATLSLVARHPHLFAAALPLAGTGSRGGAEAIADRYLYTAIWTFHGSADNQLDVHATRELVTAIRDAGGNIRYTEIPGAKHSAWVYAAKTDGIVEWLFAQKNDHFSI